MVIWILLLISCTVKNKLDLQNTSFCELEDNELKYIYNESVRRIFNTKVIGYSINTIQDIYESSIEVNCGNRYFEYLVFSKPNNDYLFKIFNENDIETIDTIVGNHLLNSISFNVQPKLVVRKLKTKPKHLSPPYLGYIEFSDIFKGLNGKYYFHILFCEKLLCDDKEDRRWASSIIFEIERCSSGLLTFSRMYGGLGDGKFIDCPDTYNCR